MEKRIGIIAVLLEKTKSVPALNGILSEYGNSILSRNGLNMPDRDLHLISLVVEGTSDLLAALAGKLGKLEGVSVKTLVTSRKEHEDEHGTVPQAH